MEKITWTLLDDITTTTLCDHGESLSKTQAEIMDGLGFTDEWRDKWISTNSSQKSEIPLKTKYPRKTHGVRTRS
ncbi:MAG: hypothetical protein ACXAD7_26075 [Candidatus Kariarchaeaceae archaeon]